MNKRCTHEIPLKNRYNILANYDSNNSKKERRTEALGQGKKKEEREKNNYDLNSTIPNANLHIPAVIGKIKKHETHCLIDTGCDINAIQTKAVPEECIIRKKNNTRMCSVAVLSTNISR